MNAVRIKGDVIEELYVRHAGDRSRLAYLLTGNSGLAEGLVQEPFVRVAGGSCTFATPGVHLRRTIAYLARPRTSAGARSNRGHRTRTMPPI